MAMRLENVVPFGRSLAEYKSMFALSDDDLDKAIIGVGAGPASFNTEMAVLGKRVVSVDPLYVLRPQDIESQFYTVVDDIIDQVKATPDDWVWSSHRSPEQFKENRVNVLRRFLADYDIGKTEGAMSGANCLRSRLAAEAFSSPLARICCSCTRIT